jgi:hypothetical protein
LIHRPGGITAGTDQQIAAGIMWVPGSISYTVAMLIGFYRWLEPESTPPDLGGEGTRPGLQPESPRPRLEAETKVLTV